ncbi:MAG: flagellar hook-basal body complex protein [Desulfurivibrionaceae bacterium]
MGISSSLYSSISGLQTMGESMSVLGDNVSNGNTTAFKKSRTAFESVLSQSVATASGSAQVGRGTTLSTIDNTFAQGSFESSDNPIDMAIGGKGFFMQRSPDNSEADQFTRAGKFNFDQEGNVVDPSGNFVQGWKIDESTDERSGTIGDMAIDKTTAPVATQQAEVITNLDSRKNNETNEARLFDSWNGTNAAGVNPSDPIDSERYDYTTSIKVYDSKGASHDVSVYFDRTTEDNKWEFLVGTDPSDDKRVLSEEEKQTYAPDERYNYEKHKGAGALMYGELQFDTAGNISEMIGYDVPPDGEVNPSRPENRKVLGATDSYYSFETNFTGSDTNQKIDLNLGAQFEGELSSIKQVLVSDKGALNGDGSNADYITPETRWADVYDSNGDQLTGDGTDGSDEITVIGYNHDGQKVEASYTVNDDDKVQDFLDELDTAFGSTATIDGRGRLKMIDDVAGDSGMHVKSVSYTDGTDPVDANPFGKGDIPVNITTPKKKIFSQDQALTGEGDSPPVSADTSWDNVYDADEEAVSNGDEFTFVGTSSDGTTVDDTFTVATDDNTADTYNTGTVQDLLDWLEGKFNADAEIDGAGRLELTDRVADEVDGYESSLEISNASEVTTGTANPWGLGTDDTTGSFLELAPDISGEDGSLMGDRVSAGFEPEARATTQYASSSTTIFQDQDGFASGSLEDVSADTDGVITGHYSNGQVLEKAQVALADFASLSGLKKEGGNVYTETTDSGAPLTGAPGANGLGTISPNSIEQSNVDLGEEFVKLITTQRGFQANSKIVTTTDEMLNTLISMKR